MARARKSPSRKRPKLPPPTEAEAVDIVSRANSVDELKLLWRNIKDMGLLTEEVKTTAKDRAEYLKNLY